MIRISYWVTPIVAGTVWLATLLGLLLYWIINEHKVHYSSMDATQHIAYISDVGASHLKPLFIAGCVLTTVLFDLSFAADRWLRHKGRLAPNTTRGEKILSGLSIAFAVLGTVGLILLSIFDTMRHPKLHNIFLLLFIVGYVLSAIFICCEYQRLGMRYREHHILRLSFYIKVAFAIIEILLAIGFVSCSFTKHYNPAAVLEWTIAFIFSAYVFSFYVDLYPAAATKQHLQVSSSHGKGGGLKMGLGRGTRRGVSQGPLPGYDAAGEMEEGSHGSDGTLSAGHGVPPPIVAGRGRRDGSRNRDLASNF